MLVKATPLLKITEHDKKKDIRERNRTGQEKERRKETAETADIEGMHSARLTPNIRAPKVAIIIPFSCLESLY